mmetsp:Transcript_9522/g.21500  ORF Transcript_9522/g.21500 Transcript_9522/m.21500 type:complete len:215 (+) Transcript_9522:1729-2373(+)
MLHNDRLFAGKKVSLRHVRHVGAAGFGPHAHAVGVLLSIGFDWWSYAAIRVSFAQDGVHGGPGNFVVPLLNVLFLGCFGFGGEERYIVSLSTKFCNTVLQLIDGCRNIGQLDDGACRLQRHFSQVGEIVGDALRFLQELWECSQDAAGDGNVARNNVHVGQGAELANDWIQRKGCKCRSFVALGVNDGSLSIGQGRVIVITRGSRRNRHRRQGP